ncbi:T-complex protein 11-domain-containing protein [Staphylotrichum tortipilum]|uniref:T-complex protein 11-domain-containing protein n=1 Tax=Staphylotrichum tortipilum TaxID=2831512 RepID=A0AAN6MM41_9PEZI|nr:T-complex protein 11-domain-containing protein [Staphylotrichum longicolle]
MSDQGAGGGLESHMPTHRRQDSAEEPIPTEPAPETRPAAESDPEALSPQHLPRGSRKSVSDRGGRVGTPQPLSRNPSNCSTSSNSREYLPTRTTPAPELQQQRQSPPTSLPAPASIPPLEPPVTKATLSELDVQKIVHNPKLRHDINFDPDLHFRPNLDGDKGKKKQEKANQFWAALLDQLVLFVTDRETFHARYGHGDWCLPVLLRAVRDIIETLVPMRDRELLNEGLNVDLLMQQFYRGVADLEKLASWLASVLKLHCAPMRDEWVDDMYQELSNGNRENDVRELVNGMRSLLSVLEAMKLDVANHQIRCLRHVLIEDTVHFEQRFFMRKMESRKLNIAPSRMWYRAAQEYTERLYAGSPLPHAHAFGEMSVFFEALSRLALPSTCLKAIPPTFIFDEDRLLKLRSDMHDSICLEICVRKFEELERLSRVTQICSKLPSYVSDEPASHRFSGDFNFMGGGSSRPSSLAFSDRSSAFSSPRNSGGFFTPSTFDAADSRSRASEVYESLLALLHTASAASNPAERWRSLAGPAALQILRYVNAPPSLHGFESQLTAWLDDVNCDTFREVETHFHQRLMAEMARRVTEFKNLAGMALFSAATGGRGGAAALGGSNTQSRSQRNSGLFAEAPREPRDEAGVEDMAARLAHLGVLHWRVWAPLAYEGNAESALGAQQQQQQQQQQQNAMF